MVESVADGIAITMRRKGFCEPGFLIHSWSPGCLGGCGPPHRPVRFAGRPAGGKERVLARQRGESLDELVEYRIQRPDGEIRTVQASVVRITYKGQPATLAVLRDITAIKHAEMEIMRLNGELERKVLDLRNANDELEAFNLTVSHDLRTPLMVIGGFAGRITKKYGEELDGKFTDQMGIIQGAC